MLIIIKKKIEEEESLVPMLKLNTQSVTLRSIRVLCITRYGGGRGEMHDVTEAIFAPDYEKQGIGVAGFAKNDWREMFLLIMLGAVGVPRPIRASSVRCTLLHDKVLYVRLFFLKKTF